MAVSTPSKTPHEDGSKQIHSETYLRPRNGQGRIQGNAQALRKAVEFRESSSPAASFSSVCTPVLYFVITFVLSAENELSILYLAHRLLCPEW